LKTEEKHLNLLQSGFGALSPNSKSLQTPRNTHTHTCTHTHTHTHMRTRKYRHSRPHTYSTQRMHKRTLTHTAQACTKATYTHTPTHTLAHTLIPLLHLGLHVHNNSVVLQVSVHTDEQKDGRSPDCSLPHDEHNEEPEEEELETLNDEPEDEEPEDEELDPNVVEIGSDTDDLVPDHEAMAPSYHVDMYLCLS
jgi:hypothetical protein